MKKNFLIFLVLSSGLYSSYTIAQNYFFRYPAFGVLSHGVEEESDDECDLDHSRVWAEFHAIDEEGRAELEWLTVLYGFDYMNPQNLIVDMYSPHIEQITTQNVEKGEEMEYYGEDPTESDGLVFTPYELLICGSYEDNPNDPPIADDPPITESELEDILNEYNGKKNKDEEDKWLNKRWEYVEDFPGLDNWDTCYMHNEFYIWWDRNNYNNVYKIECLL